MFIDFLILVLRYVGIFHIFQLIFSDNDLTDKDAEALRKIIQVKQSIKCSKLTTHNNNNETTTTTTREETIFKT